MCQTTGKITPPELTQLSHRILRRTFRSLASMEIFSACSESSLVLVNQNTNELLLVMQELVKDIQKQPLIMSQIERLRLHSGETFAHSVNVALLVLMFTQKMGLNLDDTSLLVLSGFLHDLGKRSISLNILRAPRKLTATEWEKIRLHPWHGQNFLRNYRGLPKELINGICDHHERVDGGGYPAKKEKSAISETGKIIALADVYEALSGTRPYKLKFSQERTLSIMKESPGQFDNSLLLKFEDCIKENKLNQIEFEKKLKRKSF